MYTKLENGSWTEQTVVPFANIGDNAEPSFSPDGQRIFFISNRSPGWPPWNYDIWMTKRIDSGDGWSDPVHLGDVVNSNTSEWMPSIANNGNLYFSSSRDGGKGGSDFYVAKLIDDEYAIVENLGDSINTQYDEWCPSVSPDESYIIFEANYTEGYGGTDLYISFRKQDSTWTKPRNLGQVINSSTNDECPSISGDGKYLFFGSRKSGLADIYWIDIDIIEEFRQSWLTSVTNESKNNVIKSFDLYQNYPNPFNTSTIVSYSIPYSCFVTLKIYNIMGQEVKTLINEFKKTGLYQIEFDASNYSNGIYFYQLQSDKNMLETKKMLFMK